MPSLRLHSATFHACRTPRIRSPTADTSAAIPLRTYMVDTHPERENARKKEKRKRHRPLAQRPACKRRRPHRSTEEPCRHAQLNSTPPELTAPRASLCCFGRSAALPGGTVVKALVSLWLPWRWERAWPSRHHRSTSQSLLSPMPATTRQILNEMRLLQTAQDPCCQPCDITMYTLLCKYVGRAVRTCTAISVSCLYIVCVTVRL